MNEECQGCKESGPECREHGTWATLVQARAEITRLKAALERASEAMREACTQACRDHRDRWLAEQSSDPVHLLRLGAQAAGAEAIERTIRDLPAPPPTGGEEERAVLEAAASDLMEYATKRSGRARGGLEEAVSFIEQRAAACTRTKTSP
jgi:hypothetical protein